MDSNSNPRQRSMYCAVVMQIILCSNQESTSTQSALRRYQTGYIYATDALANS